MLPFNLGVAELLVLFLVGLVIFGPKKLPQLGISIAQAINNFKNSLNSSSLGVLDSENKTDSSENNPEKEKKA